jgi:hypothetical protein
MLYKNELVIDDTNFARYAPELIGDGQQVTVNGETYQLSAKPRDWTATPYGSDGARTFEDAGFKIIPRSEWSARLKEQIERKARVSDFCKFPAFNQGRTNYCWYNGPAQCGTTSRVIQGLPYVRLSSASGACLVKGYANRGGYGMEACRHMATVGVCREDLWPNAAIDRRYDTDASRLDRLNFMLQEYIDADALSGKMFDICMTMALLTIPGAPAYNWWGHLVMQADGVEIEPGSFGLRIRNSWSETWGAKNDYGYGGFQVYREGKGTPSDCQFIRQMTPSFASAA